MQISKKHEPSLNASYIRIQKSFISTTPSIISVRNYTSDIRSSITFRNLIYASFHHFSFCIPASVRRYVIYVVDSVLWVVTDVSNCLYLSRSLGLDGLQLETLGISPSSLPWQVQIALGKDELVEDNCWILVTVVELLLLCVILCRLSD